MSAPQKQSLVPRRVRRVFGEGRLMVRPRFRFGVRPRFRLGVLRAFAPGSSSARSGAVFSTDAVCEIYMSVVSCVLPWYSSQGPRLPPGVRSVVPMPCRWLSPIRSAGAVPLVARTGNVTAGTSVVIAGRVVASRRLLLCLARLVRLGPGSPRHSGTAIVSLSYTAPPSLSRRMTGRWCLGAARRAIPGTMRSHHARRQPPSLVDRASKGGGVL
jgi:hypothetical protein